MSMLEKGAPQSILPESQEACFVTEFYGGQRFYLTRKQAKALAKAKADGIRVIAFNDLVLTTNFNWIAPVERLEGDPYKTPDGKIFADKESWKAYCHERGWKTKEDYET